MHFVRVRASGFWTLLSVVDPAEFELLDEQLSMAINGDEGGSWAPSAPIIIGGDGLEVTGPFEAADAVSVVVTSSLTIALGAQLTLVGNQVVSSAAIVQWSSGSFLNVSSGATFSMAGTATISGTFTVSSNVILSGSAKVTTAVARTYPRVATLFRTPSSAKWAAPTAGGEAYPLRVAQAQTITPGSRPDALFYLLETPDGSTLVSVSVHLTGGPSHGGLPSTPPKMSIYEYDAVAGTTTLVTFAFDASASVGAYEADHTIAISGLTELVDRTTSHFIVMLEGEAGTDAELGLVINAPVGSYTRAYIGEN
jgi:hypothetical protein